MLNLFAWWEMAPDRLQCTGVSDCSVGNCTQKKFSLPLCSRSWHYWHFCVTSNGNKLEMVANQTNLNTNLELSRAHRVKTNVTGN